jgi:hypothetical protein
MNYGVGIASALLEMNIDTETRHQELPELISCHNASFACTSSVNIVDDVVLSSNTSRRWVEAPSMPGNDRKYIFPP